MRNFFCKIIEFSLLMGLTITQANAVTQLNKGDLALKNYGFSYCLSKSNDTSMRFETGHAISGYFQLGVHTKPAYDNVKKYVDKYIFDSAGEYQDTGKAAILMACLELYNTTNYDNLIKKQRKYSTP